MRGRSRLKSLNRQTGLTLVELMVALLLSLILLYGVTTVFMANRQTYTLQDHMARVQENGRYAIQRLVRDLRRAGYKGCDSQSGFVRNTLKGSDWDGLFDVPVKGYDFDAGTTWNPAWSTTVDAPTASIDSPQAGSDIVQINVVKALGLRVTKHPDSSADIQLEAGGGDVKKGDIAMVTDCKDAAIFQVTNVTSSSTTITDVVHNTGSVAGIVPGNADKDLGKKFTGGDFMILVNRIYYIGTGAGGGPSLFRIDNGGTPVELAEGVEALQFLYGEDVDGNGTIDDDEPFRRADEVSDWANVQAVRVSIAIRSIDKKSPPSPDDKILPEPTTFDFNEDKYSITDQRLHKIYTATVVLRNQLP